MVVRSWLSFFLGTWLALFATPLAAAPAEPRVVLLDPEPSVLDAITVTLSPWGLRVVAVAAPLPPGEPSAATSSARELAREQHAGAVVWVVAPAGGAASLWIYDAQTEHLTLHALAQRPPFDDASAAAIALTVKTLLRSTTIAPPRERAGASAGEDATAPAGTSTSPPAPGGTTSAGSPSAPGPAPVGGAPSLTGPTSAHAWRLEAIAFAHVPTGADAPAAPRVGLGVSWWPTAWAERFGVGLDVRAGTDLGVSGAAFSGSFSDTVAGASARGRLGDGRFSVEVFVGPSVHVTSISGTTLASGQAVATGRADAAVDFGAIPQVALGPRLRLGLLVGAWGMLRTQRYVVGEDTILRLPALGVDLGGRASLAVD